MSVAASDCASGSTDPLRSKAYKVFCGSRASPRVEVGCEAADNRTERGLRQVLSAACEAQLRDYVATDNGGKPARSPWPGTRGVPKAQRRPDNAGRLHGDGRASPLFPQSILKHGFVQRQISNQPLQLRVLVFQLLEPPDLGNTHPRVDLLPAIERRLRDTHLSANLANRRASFRLPQGKRYLFI